MELKEFQKVYIMGVMKEHTKISNSINEIKSMVSEVEGLGFSLFNEKKSILKTVEQFDLALSELTQKLLDISLELK